MNESDVVYACILMAVATICIRYIISEWWEGKHSLDMRMFEESIEAERERRKG